MKKNLFSISFYQNKKPTFLRSWSRWIPLWIIFVFLNCNTLLPAQEADSPFESMLQIPLSAQYFESDKLGQSYVFTSDNEVVKYNLQGEETYKYSRNTAGELQFIDATDPFNVLLYYADFGEIVTLNRTLNETSTINLLDLGYQDVGVLAMSNDNNIWLYDPNDYKLKKIDRIGAVILESMPLINIVEGINPHMIVERDNQLFMSDKSGILVFDPFGKYIKTYSSLAALGRFQIIDSRIVYQKGGDFYSFDLITAKTKQIPLPIKLEEGEKAFIQTGRMFIVKASQIEIYKF